MNIISCLPTINTPSGLAYLMVSSAHFPGKSKAKDSGRESIAAVVGGGGCVRAQEVRVLGLCPWRILGLALSYPGPPVRVCLNIACVHVNILIPLAWLCFFNPKCFLLLTPIK